MKKPRIIKPGSYNPFQCDGTEHNGFVDDTFELKGDKFDLKRGKLEVHVLNFPPNPVFV